MKRIILMVIPLMVLASCSQKQGVVPAINPADMDTSVKPGDDFYMYANGGWIKNNPLKPEYARYGSFDVLLAKSVINASR